MAHPWKPIGKYPITPTANGAMGPCVLARNAEKVPMVVVMRNGHFYPCPGVPMFYGANQIAFMTVSDLTEFMEIPA